VPSERVRQSLRDLQERWHCAGCVYADQEAIANSKPCCTTLNKVSVLTNECVTRQSVTVT
jgi:hypothetical protein